MPDVTPSQVHAPTPVPAVYEAPRLQPLGTWAAVTLIQSVPINPTSIPFTRDAQEF